MFYLLVSLISCQAAPNGYIVEPIPRDNMKTFTTNPPCGGIPKGKSHLLSEPGSINPIAWKITSPSSGKCMVKISYNSDFSSFQILSPNDNSTDENGWFSCGSEAGHFTKNYIFPSEYTCEKCTLQWIWQTNNTFYYQCIDIEIQEGTGSSCEGKCKNGGYCVGGICKCPQEWVGTHCEHSSTAEPVHVLRLFIIFILLLAIVCLLGGLIYLRNRREKNTETERLFYKRYLPCLAPSED